MPIDADPIFKSRLTGTVAVLLITLNVVVDPVVDRVDVNGHVTVLFFGS
mgnify:CR=1 FL=1